jgi:WD40 repeat protein
MRALRARTLKLWMAFAAAVTVGLIAWAIVSFLWPNGPPPKQVIQIKGDLARDLELSPDGRYCAVCTRETQLTANGEEAVRVYNLLTSDAVFEAKGQGWHCSWNQRGSCLATTATQGGAVSLWATRTWRRLSELKLDRQRPEAIFETSSLCFDVEDNLHAAGIVRIDDIIPGGKFQPLVWWDPIVHPDQLPDVIGTHTDDVLSLSVGGTSEWTRVAVSYSRSDAVGSIIEIFESRKRLNGPRRIEKLFTVQEDIGKSGPCWVRLSGDGNRLAVLGTTGLWLLQVSPQRATVLLEKLRGSGSRFVYVRPSLKYLDLSYDGHCVAYTWPEIGSETEVTRISDGQTLLRVRRGDVAALSLSPDGRLLAVSDNQSHCICLYDVPQ